MKWWEIVLCVIINAVWIVPFIWEVFISTAIEKHKYMQRRKRWDIEHPKENRKQCAKCKYCKMNTTWAGLYPHGIPKRNPAYCKLLNRGLSGSEYERCLLSDPPKELWESDKDKLDHSGSVYVSAYGNIFHSKPTCPKIKNSKYICKDPLFINNIQIEKTYDLLEQGIYTEAIFKQRQSELSQKINESTSKITNLKSEIAKIENNCKTREEIIPKFINILESYKYAENAEQKNHLLRQLVTKFEYIKSEPNKKNNILTPNFELHIYPNLSD